MQRAAPAQQSRECALHEEAQQRQAEKQQRGRRAERHGVQHAAQQDGPREESRRHRGAEQGAQAVEGPAGLADCLHPDRAHQQEEQRLHLRRGDRERRPQREVHQEADQDRDGVGQRPTQRVGQKPAGDPPPVRGKGQQERGESLDDEVHPRDLDGDQRKREIAQDADDRQQHRVDGLDQEDAADPRDVVDHAAALVQHVRQGGEVRVQQHDLRRLPRGIAARAHSDAAIRLPQRRQVVHAVAGHGHAMALPLQRLDELLFLRGRDAPKDGMGLRGPFDVRLARHAGHVQVAVRLREAGLRRKRGDRLRVVAGEELQLHALALKVGQRLRRVRPDLVREEQRGQHADPGQRAVRADGAVGKAGQQHAPPRAEGRPFLRLLLRAGQALRRADDEGVVRKADRAPLPLGGKGNPFQRLGRAPRRKVRLQRLEGGVVVLRGVQEGAHLLLEGLGAAERRQADLLHAHGPLGEGSRLVQAQGVDVGERLQRIELLHEHAPAGQGDDARGKADAGQQHQPLGKHAQQPRGCCDDGLLHGVAAQKQRLQEQQDAQERNPIAGKARHLAHGGQELRAHAAQGLGLLGDAGGVVLLPHVLHAGAAPAADDKAAGEQALARGPAHGVGLPGQQGFVHLRRLGEDDGVGADLAARLQLDHVLLDQVLGGDLRGRAVVDDPRRRQGQE